MSGLSTPLTLILHINSNFLIYKYSFRFLVKPKVESGIVIEGETNGVLELEKNIGDFFEISYIINHNSGENINESISIELDNTNVVEFIEINHPIITFKVVGKASVKLTLESMIAEIPPKEIRPVAIGITVVIGRWRVESSMQPFVTSISP